jgi:hypothetical protein
VILCHLFHSPDILMIIVIYPQLLRLFFNHGFFVSPFLVFIARALVTFGIASFFLLFFVTVNFRLPTGRFCVSQDHPPGKQQLRSVFTDFPTASEVFVLLCFWLHLNCWLGKATSLSSSLVCAVVLVGFNRFAAFSLLGEIRFSLPFTKTGISGTASSSSFTRRFPSGRFASRHL